MAAVNSTKPDSGSKSPSSPISRGKTMPLKFYLTFIVIFLTKSQCFADDDDDHEMEEFLKRELSLSKPYQGISSVQ